MAPRAWAFQPRVSISGSTMLAAMALVEVLGGVVQGYLPPLLPALGTHLHIDSAGQNNIYLLSQLAFAVMTPLLSRLGDLYGHRRLLRISLAMVAAGSLLMAVWPSSVTLTVGVVLQGALVGFMPLLVAILRSREPERNRFGIGLLVGVLLVAIGVGGLVAGVLSEHHAEAGLWTAVPVALLAVIAGMLLPDSGAPRGGRFNVGAALLLTGGLVGVVLALAQGSTWGWSSWPVLGGAAGGVALLVAWVFVEQRSRHPLVSIRMLSNPRLALVSGCTFCVSFGTIGFLGANAVFLGTPASEVGYGTGLGPRSIAVIALVMVIVGFVGSTVAPQLARRAGDRAVLVSGGSLAVVGFGAMVAFHGTLAEYLVGAVVVGLANGLTESITRTLSAEIVDVDETALAVGINELALSFGSAVGAAVIGGLLAAHPLGHSSYVQVSGYLWSWGACAGLAVIGTVLALCYRNPRRWGPAHVEGTGSTPSQQAAP